MLKSSLSQAVLFGLLTLLINCNSSFAQVGINTISPDTDAILDVVSTDKGALLPRVPLSETTNSSPLANHVSGMLVYNTASNNDVFPGYYYNNGSRWIRFEGDDPVDSVSLATDEEIIGSTYSDVSGMSLTFTARKPSVYVMLTGSGLGYTNSLSNVYFQLVDVGSGSVIGGTNTKVQNLSLLTYKSGASIIIAGAYSTTDWSTSFSKLLTGLTVGNTYTIKVQGKTGNIFGSDGASVLPVTYPESNHLTLSVIQ